MGLITVESNQMRKSHRIDLPLTVQINGISYQAHDWSMTGVSLIGFTEDLEPNQIIPSKCALPMVDSMIALNINLKFKRHLEGFSGFEFTDPSPQVRRALRQYIEMAVEGKLDNLGDVVGMLTMPTALDMSLPDALTPSDLDADNMNRHFKSGSRLAIIIGILFLVVLLTTLFYNTTYRVGGVGEVSNTLQRVRAPAAGIISRMTLKPGDPVRKGMLLLSVVNTDRRGHIDALRLSIKQLVLQRKKLAQDKGNPASQLTDELAATIRARRADYDKAKLLYAQHILSLKDFNYIGSQLQNARIAYARNTQGNRLQTRNAEDKLGPLDLQLVNAREQLRQIMDHSASIVSPVNGHVFSLDAGEGSFVNAGEIVMVLAADTTPDVLLKVPNYDAVKIHVGMPAIVAVPSSGQTLQARVSAIGYSAVYGQSTPSEEASLNDTLIRLKLLNPSTRVPPNTRVNVWIKTFQWPHWL